MAVLSCRSADESNCLRALSAVCYEKPAPCSKALSHLEVLAKLHQLLELLVFLALDLAVDQLLLLLESLAVRLDKVLEGSKHALVGTLSYEGGAWVSIESDRVARRCKNALGCRRHPRSRRMTAP
jgi:hypothetical protein